VLACRKKWILLGFNSPISSSGLSWHFVKSRNQASKTVPFASGFRSKIETSLLVPLVVLRVLDREQTKSYQH